MAAKNIEDAVRAIRDGDKGEVLRLLGQGVDPNDRNKLGWTLLHIACLEGRSEIAELLLDKGASVNCCTVDMSTPLHRAAGQGNMAASEVLLKKGAYINAQDKNGNTPLHEAAKNLHTNVIKLLIDKKADKIRLNNKKQNFTDMVGQQLMPVVESGDVETLHQWLDWKLSPSTFGNLNWSLLHHASARGQINIASLLLQKGANVNAPDSNKSSSLHAACFHGNKRIVELLIGKAANVNAKDQMGNTPLHSAIRGAHPDIINILLESGCDTKIPNSEGQIFTHLRLLQQVNEFLIDAVENKRVAHVSSLLKGQANPDTKDSVGCPVLCVATFKGDLLSVGALLAAGANPNLPSDDNIKTPLHYASIWGHFFILKALLDKGASVSARDRMSKIPLHEAARGGFEDMVTVLVGRCSPLDAQDSEGSTSLHLAARWGHTSIVDMLLEKGASDSIRNNDSHTYLDLALMRAVRTEDKDQVMACLAWGGDPNTSDNKGWCLLHHAAYKGALEVCQLLIESEAEVNVVDKEGRTPLLLAAYRGNLEMTQELIDSGADMNMKEKHHNTPLHWAAAEGSIATVELLLQRGANRTIRNKEDKLYTDLLLKHLYFAVRHNDLEKVQCLLRAGADQTAIVRGTGTTPRDEAKRRKNFSILRQMLSLAPKKKSQVDAMAVEFVSYLFEAYNSGSEDEKSSSSQSSAEDPDQDAYWKMHNANVFIKAKDLLEEETKSFWKYWEEKPTVISVKDWCKDDIEDLWKYWDEKPTVISVKDWCKDDIEEFWKYWEEKANIISAKDYFRENACWLENESESEKSDSEASEYADCEKYLVISFQEVKKKWGEVISAKEFFKEDECWWRDAVNELYSSDEETDSGRTLLTMEDIKRKWGPIIPAKEFFREDECWWRDAVEELYSSSDEESAIAEIAKPTMGEIKRTRGEVILPKDVFDNTHTEWLNMCKETDHVSTRRNIIHHNDNDGKITDAEITSTEDDASTSTDYKDCESFSESWNKENYIFPRNSTMFSIRDRQIFSTTIDENSSEENSTAFECSNGTIACRSCDAEYDCIDITSNDDSSSIEQSSNEEYSEETDSSLDQNDTDSIESSSTEEDSSSIGSSSIKDNSGSSESSSVEDNFNYSLKSSSTRDKHINTEDIDTYSMETQSSEGPSIKYNMVNHDSNSPTAEVSVMGMNSDGEVNDIVEVTALKAKKNVLKSNTNIYHEFNQSNNLNVNSLGIPLSLEPLSEHKHIDDLSESESNNSGCKLESDSDDILESTFTFYIKPLKSAADINLKTPLVNSPLTEKCNYIENPVQHNLCFKSNAKHSIQSEDNQVNVQLSTDSSHTLNISDIENNRVLSNTLNLQGNINIDGPSSLHKSTELPCFSKIGILNNGNHVKEKRELVEHMISDNEENWDGRVQESNNFHPKLDNSLSFLSKMKPNLADLMVSDNAQLILDSPLTDCSHSLDTRIAHAIVDTNTAFSTLYTDYPETLDRESILTSNSLESKENTTNKQQKNVVSEMNECLAKVDASLNILKRKLSSDHPIPQLNPPSPDSKLPTQIHNSRFNKDSLIAHPQDKGFGLNTENAPTEYAKFNVTVANHHTSKNSKVQFKDTLSACFSKALPSRETSKYNVNRDHTETQESPVSIKVDPNGAQQLSAHPDEVIQSIQGSHDLHLPSSLNRAQSSDATFPLSLNNSGDSHTFHRPCRFDEPLDNAKDSSCLGSTPLTIHNASLTDASSNPVCMHTSATINHEINQVTFCNPGLSSSCTVATKREAKPIVNTVSACQREGDVVRDSKESEQASATIFVIETAVYLVALIYTIISGIMSMVITNKAS